MSRNELIMIAGMMFVTFGIRYVLLAMADRFALSPLVERALGYVPPAVLTAITVPAVLMPQGELAFYWDNPHLFAAVAAVLAGCILRRHTLLASIGGGLVVFFLWQYGLTMLAVS